MPVNIPTRDELDPYCQLCSKDPMYSSNIQLFSLSQGHRYWKELQRKKSNISDYEITEYLVFIVVCLGTSISQLLGRNVTNYNQPNKVDYPKILFNKVYTKEHCRKSEFYNFIDTYDACRHFGSIKYPMISNLSISNCQSYFELIIYLWDEAVKTFINNGYDKNDRLADFHTVKDLLE